MKNQPLQVIVTGLIVFGLLFACTAGNYMQAFEQIKKNYQKTNEIQPLIEALQNSDLRMRALAANYLGEINDSRSVAPLQKALNDPSRYVREEAEGALKKLGHPSIKRSKTDQNEEPFLEGIQVQKALKKADLFSLKLGGFPRSRTSVKSLSFSSGGRFLAAGYVYGGYLIWDIEEGHLFAKPIVAGHTNPYYIRGRTSVSVQYSDSGEIHGVGDNTSISVRKGNGKIIWENDRAHANIIGRSIGTTISIAPRSNTLISGGVDGKVKSWDLQNGKIKRVLRAEGPAITSIAISKNSKLIAAGDQSGKIFIWDLEAIQELRSIEVNSGKINSLAFTSEDKYLVSGGDDGSVKIWDSRSGALYRTLEGHDGPIISVAVSKDGRLIATGGNSSIIKIWDGDNGQLMTKFNGHTGWVEAIAFSPDGKRIASGGRDGRILIWDIKDNQIVACLANFDFLDWMIVNPSGYFNTTLDAARHLWINVNGRSYSIEPYFQSFFKPESIKQALAGRAVASSDFAELDLALPSVEIINPVNGVVIENDVTAVSILAKDSGGGVEEIALYHNGRRVNRKGARGLIIKDENKESITQFEVKLLSGLNTFSAVAFNRAGIQSRTKTISVNHPTPASEVDLHALVIGINRYKNADLNLSYAASDATAVASFLKKQNGNKLFKSVSIVTLLNEDATEQRIRNSLDDVAEKTKPEDVLTIYFCGHGQSVDDQWYFIPHDLLRPERDEEVRKKGISSRALSKYLKKASAQKVLLVMDSCKSGAALLAFRGFEDRRALMQLARASGVYIIAASTQYQFAVEVKELGHGVFTHTLLQGLYGKAAMGGQTTVTVKRLLAYVEEQLPLLSQQFKQRPQYPVVYSIGMDFPITIIE